MITKYRARKVAISELITKVEVEKETEKTVWIKGRRKAKKTDYENYFDTFEEAKAFLAEYAEAKLNIARLQLERARGFAGNVKGLRAP